jgi:hypothetical protein
MLEQNVNLRMASSSSREAEGISRGRDDIHRFTSEEKHSSGELLVGGLIQTGDQPREPLCAALRNLLFS